MNREKLQELRAQVGNTFTGQLIDALLEDDTEWIEWGGYVTPPLVDDPVEVQFRDGTVQRGERARWSWGRSGEGDDIVRYRPIPKTVYSPPRVDRSLRGWVIINEDAVGWAEEDGICETRRDTVVSDWDFVESEGWTVRKLTPEDIGFKVRYPGEWNATEKDELKSFCRGTYDIFSIADKAIDIATRGTHE